MGKEEVRRDYFEWMFDMMCGERFAPGNSYKKLFEELHEISFRYSIRKDRNRASDGEDLRYRYALELTDDPIEIDDIIDILDQPCTVLEMMIALAIRAEEDIMDDPNVGNRTAHWFWGMINNLGLGSMIDERFDRIYVDNKINILLDRKYAPNGKGGLFLVRDCDQDLREVEIWYQLCWYIDERPY